MTARQRHSVKALWPVDEVSPDGPPAWTIGAPCKYDPDRWFSDDPDEIEAAKAICTAVCPLERRIACMDYAFDHGIEYGVFGGVSREERVEKHCARCDQVKAITEFGADVTHADGVNAYCRECTNAAARARANKSQADPAQSRTAMIAPLRAEQQRQTAAAKERVARYAHLWWDQRLPRSVAMKQVGIGSVKTAEKYEAKIRKQQKVVAA